MHMNRDCPHCGQPILTGAIFCLDCGGKIIGDKPTAGGERLRESLLRASPVTVDSEKLEPGTYLVVLEGIDKGRTFPVAGLGNTLIGRKGAEVPLQDPFVSRRHAEIRVEDGSPVIYDLESANSTFVNSRLAQRCELQDGDLIDVGYSTFLFFVKV